jgi:hypothetical protein
MTVTVEEMLYNRDISYTDKELQKMYTKSIYTNKNNKSTLASLVYLRGFAPYKSTSELLDIINNY